MIYTTKLIHLRNNETGYYRFTHLPSHRHRGIAKVHPWYYVSGGAKGADTYAREFAKKKGLKLIEYFPNYDKYGKGVPLERNKLIVEECDCVLAFWDGQSHGTKFTLDYAKEKNKPIKIIQIW